MFFVTNGLGQSPQPTRLEVEWTSVPNTWFAVSRPAKRVRIVAVFVAFPQLGIAYYWSVTLQGQDTGATGVLRKPLEMSNLDVNRAPRVTCEGTQTNVGGT